MGLTGVDKSPRGSFAELLGLVGQRDFHHPGDVPGWGLHPDGVGGDQLEPGEEIRSIYMSGLCSTLCKYGIQVARSSVWVRRGLTPRV